MKYQNKVLPFLMAIIFVFSIFLFHPALFYPAHANTLDYVYLSDTDITLKIGDEYCLRAFTLSGKTPRFKSSRSGIASVNSSGIVTAKKAGTVKITAKVSGYEAYCTVTVKPTTITISSNRHDLYRNQSFFLKVRTSTGHTPTFRSSRSSVATVDKNGLVTAKKNGTANIKITCDRTTVLYEITVLKPEIDLSNSSLTLKVGESKQVSAKVSSGNPVTWSVSNINILSVDKNGTVTARQKGKAYLYAYEDGTKVSCIVRVTE